MSAAVWELAPWSTADERERRHLALVRARWDLRMAREALKLAERFRSEALAWMTERPSDLAAEELCRCQRLVSECQEDVRAAEAKEREVTALVRREDGSVAAEVGHLAWDREHHARNAAETRRRNRLDRFQQAVETARNTIRGMRLRAAGNNNGAPMAPVEEMP